MYSGGFVAVGLLFLLAWKLSAEAPLGRKKEIWDTKAQVVGWASAFLYCEFAPCRCRSGSWARGRYFLGGD